MRSEGSRLLGAVEATQVEIARRVGVKQSTVAAWIAGQKTPIPKHRQELRTLYGIPYDAWPAKDPEVAALREELARVKAEAREIAIVVIEETSRAAPEVLERIADRLDESIRR